MDISVIICTRNRSYALTKSLDSVYIAMQKSADVTVTYEVLIIDNNSTDNTFDIASKWIEKHNDINARIIKEPQTGLSYARNCALDNTTGNIIVYTDDDCCLSENYFIDMLAHSAKDTFPVVRGGRIELGDPSDVNITTKTSDKPESWSKQEKSARYKTLRGAISGCNLVIPREVINQVGSFDTKLGAGQKISGSEDSDFICRAYLKGFTIEYVPDMCVYHFHGRKKNEEVEKLLIGYNIGAGALYIKHILNDFDLFRPFLWNIKNAIKEIKTGKNLYLPEYNISYKKITLLNIKGMFMYLII